MCLTCSLVGESSLLPITQSALSRAVQHAQNGRVSGHDIYVHLLRINSSTCMVDKLDSTNFATNAVSNLNIHNHNISDGC